MVPDQRTSLLLTDLYQFSMIESYLDEGMLGTAVFELFFRKLPRHRGFLFSAGLEQALAFLEELQFSEDDIDWLRTSGGFSTRLCDYLAGLRFTGDVDAMPEGTVFFADEPIIRVTAPLPVAQLVETRLINLLHFQTLIASKAARMVLAAPDKLLVDFGLRRAHGSEAGLLAARASYIAGFGGTATVLAHRMFGIPVYGTMAHSFIQVHDSETEAFERFAHARPASLTLLIDTYDTEAGARKVVALAPRLRAAGIRIASVRLDSGDLVALSRRVRRILDDGGLSEVRIFASGGLDEESLMSMRRADAPIDGFGIGTSLATSSDLPALDCAYKLQEYAGVPRRKQSARKATWPGRKQIWRHYTDGRIARDVLSLHDDLQEGEALIVPAMRGGRRVGLTPTLQEIRERAGGQLSRLPDPLQGLGPVSTDPVVVAPALVRLTEAVDRRLSAMSG